MIPSVVNFALKNPLIVLGLVSPMPVPATSTPPPVDTAPPTPPGSGNATPSLFSTETPVPTATFLG